MQTNSFSLMPDLARRMPRPGTRWLLLWRAWYAMRALWRHVRIQRPLTWLLGPQYQRSRDLIEIDITYLCNLHCLNCNRSVTQAREALHISLEQITRFVDDSIARGKRWRRIRVLGGEPTLHPRFQQIMTELLRYRAFHAACLIEVVTNGFGARVKRALSALPPEVLIDNSEKTSPLQPTFGPFNLAPADDGAYRFADYGNGCAVLEECGMGLTPLGYYPCAVAGGIDRVLGESLGSEALPGDEDEMLPVTRRSCKLCGRFRDGHFIPRLLRPRLLSAPVSRSWQEAYERWHARASDTTGTLVPLRRRTRPAPFSSEEDQDDDPSETPP